MENINCLGLKRAKSLCTLVIISYCPYSFLVIPSYSPCPHKYCLSPFTLIFFPFFTIFYFSRTVHIFQFFLFSADFPRYLFLSHFPSHPFIYPSYYIVFCVCYSHSLDISSLVQELLAKHHRQGVIDSQYTSYGICKRQVQKGRCIAVQQQDHVLNMDITDSLLTLNIMCCLRDYFKQQHLAAK